MIRWPRRIAGHTLRRCYEIGAAKHYARRYQGYRERYDIDPAFRFNGDDIAIFGEGEFRAMSGAYIGERSRVAIGPGTQVIVGRNCRIGRNVNIYTITTDADAAAIASTAGLPVRSGDVLIGEGVWIGVNCFIGPDVEIGDDAVIGANSVVTRSVEARTIVGGVPARLIRRKSPAPGAGRGGGSSGAGSAD